MKNYSLTFLLAFLSLPFSAFCGATINLSQGGPNGYQDMTITIDDAGNKVIHGSQPGYSICPYLSSEVPKQEKNPKEYQEYSALVQIAVASIKQGIASGKMISANSAYACEWTADPKDISTFQIKVSDLKK